MRRGRVGGVLADESRPRRVDVVILGEASVRYDAAFSW